MATGSSRQLAPFLWVLLFFFILRVLAQVVVGFGWGAFLPPMEEWYSGLISYPYLLAAQIMIIVLFVKVCLDFTRGESTFVRTRRVFGHGVLCFGYLYLAAMIIRYIVRMSLYSEERWLGGAIPIVFHWVLALYVILFGRYHRLQFDSRQHPA